MEKELLIAIAEEAVEDHDKQHPEETWYIKRVKEN